MSPKSNSGNNSGDIWRNFIATEQKANSKLGKLFAPATFGGYDNGILTLYFADEALSKQAKGQIQPLQNKLKIQLPCERIDFRIGIGASSAQTVKNTAPKTHISPRNMGNPLQALKCSELGKFTQPVLQAAVDADNCRTLYDKLKQRTISLAGGEKNTIAVTFNWRVRVGGTRGFCELLLPAFHPVFGIPYIPASSLKGAARNWAKNNVSDKSEIYELLGMLDGKKAKAAKIEFLDAFPTTPCLSVDVATPQWHRRETNIVYKPEPHPLLSLERPQFVIGLRPTKPEYSDKVDQVKTWLQNALNTGGIGSRVSGGYGRTLSQEACFSHSKSFDFELWTQGMYGSNPPTKENGSQGTTEFRPTAIRGILRYWFRAVSLGLYDSQTSLILEELLFGKLGQQGTISITTRVNEPTRRDPYFYNGKIILEAKEKLHLQLIECCLFLASHLGGVGRGSRRPLHRLNGRMRGCHWLVEADNYPLPYDVQQWKLFFQSITAAFEKVQSATGSYTSSPGDSRQRRQDVLDKNSQVWLLKTTDFVPPNKVKNWQTEGDSLKVKGGALNLLYENPKFKGLSNDTGNANVGGKLETPSFVWIKSIFPAKGDSYQVVTIFGADHPDRLQFAKALQQQGAVLVYGAMPSAGQTPSQNTPRPTPRRRN